jgi:hypothetical protein
MPQSANFNVQNALKLTYKHPEIPKKFLGSLSLAIKGTLKREGLATGRHGRARNGRKGKGRRGQGRAPEGRGWEGRGYSHSKNVSLSSLLAMKLNL